VLISNDTDVLVLGLYYWHLLREHGLKEFWIRAGVANKTRYLPLRISWQKYGEIVSVMF
jgi:hypothetical protein